MTTCFTFQPISVPSSFIKSPGMLNRNNKPELTESQVNKKDLHTLLEEFKEMTYTETNESPKYKREELGFTQESSPSLVNFFTSHSTSNILSPGKLKAISDSIHQVVLKAKEILHVYGIELVIEDLSKYFKEIYQILKFIVVEICFFPTTFFRTLQVSQLLISKREITSSSSRDFSSLVFSPHDTQTVLVEKLYNSILDNLIMKKPAMLVEWDSSVSSSQDYDSLDGLDSIREAFMALMKTLKDSSVTPIVKKLREMLAYYFPEEMSEEWFTNRNKEKKKLRKVRFARD